MVITCHTVTTTASPEAVWNIWKDAANWPAWDHELESVKLTGAFKTETLGVLKPVGGPNITFSIDECTPNKSFLTVARMPLTRFYANHTLEVKNGLTHVTHVIEMKGLLAFFFAFVIGRGMKKYLPTAMNNLVALAEGRKL